MARLPKPWYRAERKAWFVTINGVQHNLGPDKKDAQRRFHALMREPKSKRVSSLSLAAIIDEFLEWVQKNRSPANYEGYRYRLERFARQYPDLTPEDLRPYHVEKWADSYDVSVTTRRNYLRAVKRCIRWAKEQGYIDDSPVAYLKIPAGANREIVIRPDEFEAILALAPDRSLKDLLIAAWETGCRPQEILKVTAHHVDLVNKRWIFKRSEAKMKRNARVIYLGDQAFAITKQLMQQFPEGPIFRNSRGRPWTTCAVNCAFRRIRLRLGMEKLIQQGGVDPSEVDAFKKSLKPTRVCKGKVIKKSDTELRSEARRKLRYKRAVALAPKYSLYALRHSFATNALERGLDALTVAVLMGHKDPSMLARVYQHLSHNPERLLEQARKATASGTPTST